MARLIATLSFVLFFVPAAHAATASFSTQPSTIGKGDRVEITLAIDSDAPVNTFSGTLVYPADLLEPVSVSDGNSIVNVWLTRPTTTALSFVGFTPGGFAGNSGKLFSVIFMARASGTATLAVNDLTVLRNDGVGTQEEATTAPLSFAIVPTPQGGFSEPVDTTPPEPFAITRSTDPALFAGDASVVFMAADKGSGIASYEVAESRMPFMPDEWLAWKSAVSPYRLSDQSLVSDVYVKAIDRAGNERAEVIPRVHLFSFNEWTILAMLTLLAFWWYWRRMYS